MVLVVSKLTSASSPCAARTRLATAKRRCSRLMRGVSRLPGVVVNFTRVFRVSTFGPRHRRSRSPATLVLLSLAVIVAALAAFVGITTALGFAHADVRGHRLTGSLEGLLLAGLSVVVLGSGAAAIGFWRQLVWSVPAFAAVWPAFALVSLVLDRITPVSGPGRPLWFYLIVVGTLPATAVVLLGRRQRADERAASIPLTLAETALGGSPSNKSLERTREG